MTTPPHPTGAPAGVRWTFGIGVLLAAGLAASILAPMHHPTAGAGARATALPTAVPPGATALVTAPAPTRPATIGVPAGPAAKPPVSPAPAGSPPPPPPPPPIPRTLPTPGLAASPAANPSLPAATAPAQPSPVPSPVASDLGETLRVAHTDGLGVYIRGTPNPDDRIKVWLDGTPMVVVGPDRQVGGTIWKNVRDPSGYVGWVPAAYVTTPSAATDGTTVEADSKLVFVGTPRYVPGPGNGQVIGQIENTAAEPLSGVLRARLVDATGRTVGNADGVVTDVQPGESRLYALTTSPPPTSIASIVPVVVLSRPGNAAPDLAIDHVAVQTDAAGAMVVGQIHNAGDASYAVALIAGFVDAQGNLSGTARGIVSALGPGKTAAFSLAAPAAPAGGQRVVVQVAAVSDQVAELTQDVPAPSQTD